MSLSRRKLTFQLTPLLDLLLIVIFAQYMEVQQTADTRAAETAEQIAKLESSAELAELELRARLEVAIQEQEQLERERNRLQATLQRREVETDEELLQSRREVRELGQILLRMFRLPPDIIERAIAAQTEEERNQLRRDIEAFAGGNADEMVRHLRTWRELLKRCDVWDIHIGEDNVTTLNAAGKTFRFRAETAERFEAELYARYKALPQPKDLVVLLLSWSDAEFSARKAGITGVAEATERMHLDSNRRTRFEYAVLGYSPDLRETNQ